MQKSAAVRFKRVLCAHNKTSAEFLGKIGQKKSKNIEKGNLM
jgi:hypothetical protein